MLQSRIQQNFISRRAAEKFIAVMVELLDVVDRSRVSIYDMELEETEEHRRLARRFRKDRHAVMTGLCRIAMENDGAPHCFAAWSLAANLARGADSDIRNILWSLSVRMLESHPMPGVRDRVVCNLPTEFPKPVLLELFRTRLRAKRTRGQGTAVTFHSGV